MSRRILFIYFLKINRLINFSFDVIPNTNIYRFSSPSHNIIIQLQSRIIVLFHHDTGLDKVMTV